MQQPDSGRGAGVGGDAPVEIHRVLCGNNTRQNERLARVAAFHPALFEEYTRSEAGF